MVVAALGKLRGQTGSSTMSHVFRNKNVYSILPYRYGAPLGLYINYNSYFNSNSIRLASKLELVLTRAVVVEERRRCGRPDARASCGLRDPGAGPRGRLAASEGSRDASEKDPRFVESQLIRYPTPRCTRVEYRIKAQRSTTVSTLRTPSRSRIRALEPSPRVESPPRVGQPRASGDPRRFDRPPHIRLKHNMDIGAVLKGQTPLADSLSHTAIGIRV